MRIRTGYSFRFAVGHLEDVMKRLKGNYSVAPISDRMSTFGFNRWTKLCEKDGMRPIYGVELGVAANVDEKKVNLDYWTFFATKELKSLHALIYLATDAPGHEPYLNYKQAMSAKGVIKIANNAVRLNLIKPAPDLYIALAPSTPKGLYLAAKKAKHQFIACSDNVFPAQEDKEFYRVTLGKRANNQTYKQYILTDAEWKEAVSFADPADIKKALLNRDKVQKQCNAKLLKADLLVPEKKKTLKQLCIEGARRVGVDLKNKVYKERLERELKLIDEKNFEDYFYIISDMIRWAKQRMIVGPARGSSCGSLVCYLLDITSIDPIPFGLIFERFIDINRVDLPDIDIDFSDDKRHMVFEYVEEKYGKEHVARLGTIMLFKPRSALKQAGIALRIPIWLVEKVLDSLLERSSGDSRANLALEDTLTTTDVGKMMLKDYPEALIAGKMEGHPNNASQHAAGIVITNSPVMNFVAVDKRTKSIMCDKRDAEDLNLLKIDALGLTQLSIFERTLELIGEKPVSGWLEKIPLNDPAAFDVLNKGHFAGIFQFTGISVQGYTKMVKVNHIEDMISLTALARPGPLATGGTNTWVRRRIGQEKATYATPLMEEYTKDTFGVVVYQEQVMNIARNIGKLSWKDTSDLRKAMSKSYGDEFFAAYWEKFRKGAIENKIDEGVAKALWDQINKFGSWAFNRSHAVAYGLVSYWCCWLKAHHPLEFAAATLDAESDPVKQIQLLRELADEGIDYISVDPKHSTDRWVPIDRDGKKVLVGPLTQIKGIGPVTMKTIISCREKGEELKPSLQKKLENAKTDIDSLYPIRDAIRRLHPDLSKIKITTPPTPIIKVQCGIEGAVVITGIAKRIAFRDVNDAQFIMKRGYKIEGGPTKIINMFLMDDTDEIFCKVDRYDFERLGQAILNKGRAGKSLYAIKGTCPANFRMISIDNIRFLGDIDEEPAVKDEEEEAA